MKVFLPKKRINIMRRLINLKVNITETLDGGVYDEEA